MILFDPNYCKKLTVQTQKFNANDFNAKSNTRLLEQGEQEGWGVR